MNFIIRLISLPFYLLILILLVFEMMSIIISAGLMMYFYSFLFKVDYDKQMGSLTLWDKLNKITNK